MSTDDFGQTVMDHLENVNRWEEKESGCVEIKLEHHLVTEFGLNKSRYQR